MVDILNVGIEELGRLTIICNIDKLSSPLTAVAARQPTTLTQASIFNNKTFAIGDTVAARFHVSYIDYTIFYELLDDEDLPLTIGFTARDFNGEVSVGKATDNSDNTCNDPNPSPDRPCNDETSLASGQINTNKIKPMLYLAS